MVKMDMHPIALGSTQLFARFMGRHAIAFNLLRMAQYHC
jgi:hypothetical protein